MCTSLILILYISHTSLSRSSFWFNRSQFLLPVLVQVTTLVIPHESNRVHRVVYSNVIQRNNNRCARKARTQRGYVEATSRRINVSRIRGRVQASAELLINTVSARAGAAGPAGNSQYCCGGCRLRSARIRLAGGEKANGKGTHYCQQDFLQLTPAHPAGCWGLNLQRGLSQGIWRHREPGSGTRHVKPRF